MRTAKTSLSIAAVTGALVVTGMMAAPSADATPQRHNLARTTPTWVAKAHSLGTPSSKATTAARVYLQPRGGTEALKADVAKVSDPKSPSYRHFLSAAQYHRTYDATAATVKTVSGYLRANHLAVTSVAPHRRYISVSGNNADVQKAFGVTLKKFRHAGQVVQANTDAVTLPADIASSVTTVTGLDTTVNKMRHFAKAAPPSAGFRNAKPCSRYYGQVSAKFQADYKTPLPTFQGRRLSYAPCGYTGPQYRQAYEGDAQKYTGKGVTVAILDAYASPTIRSDADKYASQHGDGSYTSGQFSQVLPSSFAHQEECDASGWYGEETLDVEAVHAMAPESNIRYYGGKSCYDADFLDLQQKVVDENKASIITNSYGEPEEALGAESAAAEQQVFLQAARQGQSFLFSSGDNGDELANTAIKQADASATDPYVTAVGGTADAIGSDGNFLFQAGWGTEKYSLSGNGKTWSPVGFLYGAGGGESALWNKPSYQNGVVPSSYGSGRQVPDISMDADPNTGMLVGQTQTFPDGVSYGEYRIGGTSLASPLMAGMTALRSQKVGGRLGFLNPAIYKKAGSSAYRDVTGKVPDAGVVRADYVNGLDASQGLLYSVRTFNQDSSLTVNPGWDQVTGVGSPNGTWVSGK